MATAFPPIRIGTDMSASDRAAKKAMKDDARFTRSAMEGLRQTLHSPDGRAFLWRFYTDNVDAEGEGSKGRRAFARELMRAARIADFDMLQIMREEWERPKAREEAEAEEGDEE